MSRALSSLILIAALAAGPALAQPRGGRPPMMSGGEGEGREGGLTRRVELFISPSGEPVRGRDGLSAWIAATDADGDGAVTLEEFHADAERAFKRFDTDGDGEIDGFEVQAYERDVAPEITLFSFDQGPGGGPPRGRRKAPKADKAQQDPGAPRPFRPAGTAGAARYSLINEPQPLSGADTDQDRKVSAAEWRAATTRRFSRLDRDGSGRLTRESLTAPRGKIAQK